MNTSTVSFGLEKLDSRTLFSTSIGAPDPAFNHGHLIANSFPGGSSAFTDIVARADGKILAVGTLRVRQGSDPTDQSELLIAQYNFDGSFDTSFGAGGSIIATPRSMDGALHVELTPDGGFLIMGSNDTDVASQGSEMLLKFTAAGKIDTSFGKNGQLKLGDATIFTVDPSGRILVGGFLETDQAGVTDAILTRYTADGTLDTSFNKTGQFTVIHRPVDPGGNLSFTFNSFGFDTQGRILAGMLSHEANADTGGGSDLFIYRLTDNGKIDRTYAQNGKTDILGNRVIAKVLDDGSIILVGADIAKITPDGALDPNYGTNGIDTVAPAVRPTPTNNIGVRIGNNEFTVGDDGSVVFTPNATLGELQLLRVNAAGQTDTDFGDNGILTVSTNNDPDEKGELYAVETAPDGSLIFAGEDGLLSNTGKTDTRTATVGRIMSTAGPAVQLVPRTLTSSRRYLSFNVLIRDPDGIDVSTLDDSDLKLFDADGHTRKIRLLDTVDVNGDGTYINATYRIVGPSSSNWSSASNGAYEVRLQRKQIADTDGNNAAAQVLGTVRVKIA